MVLACQTDMTRVITFQMGHEMSLRSYPELGFSDSHHSQTHHHGEPEKIAKTTKINIFHTKMLAYYLDKLRTTPDGDGSLLDHSMILYGAALSDANLHLYTDLPLLLVGGSSMSASRADSTSSSRSGPRCPTCFSPCWTRRACRIGQLGDSTGRLDLATSSPKSADGGAQRKTL